MLLLLLLQVLHASVGVARLVHAAQMTLIELHEVWHDFDWLLLLLLLLDVIAGLLERLLQVSAVYVGHRGGVCECLREILLCELVLLLNELWRRCGVH